MARLLCGAALLAGCQGGGPAPAAGPTAPRAEVALRVEAESPLPLGNVAVRPTGEILVSLHPFFGPPFPVGTLRQSQVVPLASEIALVSVLGLRVDAQGGLWLLDRGDGQGVPPRLVHLSATGEPARVFELGAVTTPQSFINDLTIDLAHETVYIADPARGTEAALIVVDTRRGQSRRVLQGHLSVVAEAIDLSVRGRALQVASPGGASQPLRVGVNPIALDTSGTWLYFGPMHATSLYRIETAALRDPALSPETLAARVRRHAEKPICDGIAIDGADNIYLGDLAKDALGVIDAQGRYRVLSEDPRLRFVNAITWGPDGRLYAVAAQVDRAPLFNQGVSRAEPPFLLLSFSPLASR